MIKSVLVDARNVREVLPAITAKLNTAEVIGFDIETQDEDRHPGLNVYNNKKRHVFDHRRTVITGFSTYVEGDDTAYYFNTAHADVENRLPEGFGAALLEEFNPDALIIAHNAPFELTMTLSAWELPKFIDNMICTLQMAVSHHGPDEYPLDKFYKTPLPFAFAKTIAPDVLKWWADFERGDRPAGMQQEVLGKFIAKESKSAHNYNGFVDSISIGYNLKKLTMSIFGYKMTTYDEVLAAHGAKHMGELTGEQVVSYGADDAYWAVRHFRYMFDDMLATNPPALRAFLLTENPMIYEYAQSWFNGIRLNLQEVFKRRDIERHEMAELLRRFKVQLKAFAFPAAPNEKLMEKEDWYAKHHAKKRKQILDWIASADATDDFEQVFQVANPVGNGWASERGVAVPAGKLNLGYWQTQRVLMYDLLGLPIQYDKGSVASDKEARGRIRLKLDDPAKMAVMESIHYMAEIDQRMKLYLTPYTLLMDPETSRVYPSLSSQLATRRLAMSFPNAMQLSKLGESAYIRGFYLGDDDDDVVVSADWSAIELVLIGEFSGDEGFRQVYGQLPYGDMHSGAAVDGLSVKTLPGLTEEEFKEFKYGRNPNARVLVDMSGKTLTPSDFHKWARGTAVGKGINFSYWYSGALSTVANNLGWSDTQHWDAVDKYRARFPEAEAYRVGIHDEAATYGFVTLPDGHRRNRFEATSEWARQMKDKFIQVSAAQSMQNYADMAIRRLQGRARNQAVNSVIQGTCATLAKRTLINIRPKLEEAGIKARLMMPIHDELVFTVKRRDVLRFIPIFREAMTNHPQIVSSLPLHCTVAIGRTFRPFSKTDPKLTQIELDEASAIEGVIGKEYEGKALNEEQVATLLDWMFT